MKPERGNWTAERLIILKRCFDRGDSFSQIGMELGCTKNAALGKAQRLGMTRKPIAEPGAARVRDFCIPKGERPKVERPVREKLAPIPDKDTRRKMVLAASNAGVATPAFRPPKAVSPDIAMAPRPWLTRRRFECAYPVAGAGAEVVSCCNPTDGGSYCVHHGAVMFTSAPGPVSDARRFDGAVVHGRKVAAA